jgi:type VI secretion system protein ImpB
MAQASSQHKLDRVRPPRVHITYDVEIGDAIEIRTLPFQLGVLGDFTGMPTQPLARLRDRRFVEVTPDNFDEVIEGMAPHLAFTVKNTLAGTDGAPGLRVDLHFRSLEDFEPANVARQIKPLRELLDLRSKLNDLLGRLQGNDRLEELLTNAITDPDKLKKLESEIHGSDASITAPPAAAEAISVEPQALDHIPEAESVDLAAVITPPSSDVETEAETVRVSEEASTPPIEAEQVDLAPNAEAALDAPTEDEQVTPALEAAVTDVVGEKVEEEKESEGPGGIHATEDTAD